MTDIKVCRICLRTEAKVYHFNTYRLKFYYEEVMALQFNEQDGLPNYFCYECATILHKFHRFKEKCFSGQKTLRELAWRGPITYEAIYKLDRQKSMHITPVTLIDIPNQIKNYISKNDIKNPVDDDIFDPDKVEKIENLKLDYFSETSLPGDSEPMLEFENFNEQFEDEKIEVDSNEVYGPNGDGNNIVNIKCEVVKDKTKKKKLKGFGSKVLSDKHWKKITMNEDEALKNFRARAEDKKYVDAAYKCSDCFRGFSKKDMLDRHLQLRHLETLGDLECRFCRMRYKLKCYLRKHLQQHYVKYECLRCHVICPLEHTAILHNEYHSGLKRKCEYCDQEFRHLSTYYTHLRTHRSEHVCTLCGESFVSHTGLNQHKRIKHIIDKFDSPGDDEEVDTYCVRCDITFETRKAFEEHMFHSALHGDGDFDRNFDQGNGKKVLGKKEQAKVTKSLRKRNTDAGILIAEQKPTKARRKRGKEHKKRKPTTCHQCGKHFETQAACLKHHLSEHPRTSFFPPNQRYICEICGSSLAPGSIQTHKNIHSREKVYRCDTCGREFHAAVGLKRHQVTHTGEKPFSCSLCDKRFTQSNSMKLHYRTFHLKEPYPKRIRRKGKELPKSAEHGESSSEDDSDISLPDIESGMLKPNAGIKPVAGAQPDKPSDDSMHYLTLT